jgi:hypothetical protein
MPRLAFLGSATLVALACAALPACGQQDETQRIIAQCSEPPPDMLDSCLEQVRVQQETDPSPELGKLLAQLIKRQVEARNPPGDASTPPPEDNGVNNDAATPPPSPDLGGGGTYEAPPDVAPEDEAPPAEQGNPYDPGQDEATGPPTPLPGADAPPNSPPGNDGAGPNAI